MKKFGKTGIIVMAAVIILSLVAGCNNALHVSKPVSSAASASVPSSAVSSAAPSQAPASSSAPASSAVPSSQPAASGSASRPPVTVSAPKVKTITLSIDGSRGGCKSYSFTLNLQAGDTAFTVLQRACSQNEILFSYQKSPSVYIQAIEGIGATDASHGWLYSVNKDFPDEGCDKYVLKAGDSVLWVYTTDGGKSEGAPQ